MSPADRQYLRRRAAALSRAYGAARVGADPLSAFPARQLSWPELLLLGLAVAGLLVAGRSAR